MKILIVIPGLPLDLDKVKGGAVSAAINLVKGFALLPDVKVRLLSYNKETPKDIQKELYPNVVVYWAAEGPFPFHSMNYLLKGPGILRKQIRAFDPDIIHMQAGNTMSFIRWGVKTRAKFVLTIHGMALQEAKRKKKLKDKMSWYFNAWLQDKTFPRNVIHLSNFSISLFGHLVPNNTIIPNAITQGFFEIPPKGKMENRLLYMGVIDNNKNLIYQLQQLEELRNRGIIYHLDVLGDFIREDYKNLVMQYLDQSQIRDQVIFHGWVPQSGVMKFIAGTDVLVVSSQHESLPMVIAECMAAGKVVAASAVGGIPEMVSDQTDGFLFNLAGSNELADILAKLFNNTQLVNSISGKAREKALEKYQCENVARKTLAFYKTCL